MFLLAHWLLSALAIVITAYLLPSVHVDSFFTALVVSLILGLVNVTIRPLLLILTLPITILTLGLFTLVINAAMVLLVSFIVRGFDVPSLGWAFVFSIVLWAVNTLIRYAVHESGRQ